MNIRGVVADKIGNRVFLRPSFCECDRCPRSDLTQAQSLTDLDKVQIGDKMESYGGQMWYKVVEFTPNAELDALEDRLNRVKDMLTGMDDDGFGRFKGNVSRHLNG